MKKIASIAGLILAIQLCHTGQGLAIGPDPGAAPPSRLEPYGSSTQSPYQPSSATVECRPQVSDAGYAVRVFEKPNGQWELSWSELTVFGARKIKTEKVIPVLTNEKNGDCTIDFKKEKGKSEAELKLSFSGDPLAGKIDHSNFQTSIRAKKISIPVDCVSNAKVISTRFKGCKLSRPLFQVGPTKRSGVSDRATKPLTGRPLFQVDEKPVEQSAPPTVDSIEKLDK